jgi:glycosyltransferase involved in cell wall biosynthesis
MKILMLLDSEFPPDVRVESEAQSLIQQGHEVHLVSYNYGEKSETELFNGIHLHRFIINKQVAKKSKGFIHQFPVYKNIWKKQVSLLIDKLKVDAVHIHDLPLCILIGYLRKKYPQIKVVADMHENYPYLVIDQPFMNTFFAKLFLSKKAWFVKEKEWLLKAIDIVCVAPEMKIRLKSVLGSDQNISIVPNTLGFKSFVTSQKPIEGLKDRFKDYFNILYIGGFDPIRGLEYLIEAASKIKSDIPNLRIVLVGDGNIVPALKELATSLNIEKQVIFEGWQSQNHIQAYIEIADICVIPHLKSVHTDSTSSNKLFQYMYFAKPLVSSNCVPLEKVINEEQCGLIFKDRNSDDLASKLLELYRNQPLMHEMGINGQKAVNEKYNWDFTVQPLLDIYSKN